MPFPFATCMLQRSPRAWLATGVLLIAMLGGTGCHTARFYAQAVHGQSQMLHRQTAIEKLLANTNTTPELAARLRVAQDILTFAEAELGLPAHGHYLSYADLGRRYAVWNVYAAPEFSLEAKAWWYPVVGRLKYQGYFRERSARRLAERLKQQGYDVHVGGVQAYSTLGWFRDPILNTFIFDSDADLADLLFHELAHQRLFVAGDTDFNESFATAVAEEGVRRWLRARGQSDALVEYEEDIRRKEQFLQLLAGARRELTTLYSFGNPLDGSSTERLRTGKAAAFARLQQEYAALKAAWGGCTDYDNWFNRPLNNALLNTVETYFRLQPAFRSLLARCDGRLEKFYGEAERLTKLDSETRQVQLEQIPVRAEGLPGIPAPVLQAGSH
jgi:predicted aminopeptidase